MRFDAPVLLYGAGREAHSTRTFLKERSPGTRVYVTVDSGDTDIPDTEVILPADLTEAVKAKKFFIYAVTRVEEAIELLLGMPAGTADRNGRFPEGTVLRKVADRLEAWRNAEKREEAKPKDLEEEEIAEEEEKNREKHPVPEEVPLPRHTRRRSRRL